MWIKLEGRYSWLNSDHIIEISIEEDKEGNNIKYDLMIARTGVIGSYLLETYPTRKEAEQQANKLMGKTE